MARVGPTKIEISLLPSATLREAGGSVSVHHIDGVVSLGTPAPAVVEALHCLANGGSDTALLENQVETHGPADLSEWYYCLEQLERSCMVRYAVRDGSRTLVQVIPMQGTYRETWVPETPRTSVTLSRFAHIRTENDRWVVESPLSLVRVELPIPGGALMLERLGRPTTARGLAIAIKVPLATASSVLDLLLASRIVTPVSAGGEAEENADQALVPWEPADLMLHSRSRLGRHDRAVGAVYPFRDTFPPLPAVKQADHGSAIPLPRPNLTEITRGDPPFTEVLESRRSHRRFGDAPLTLRQVSEFLFRSARIRSVKEPNVESHYETSSRPYPSGGACYPLEVYVAVDRCTGLEAGLYHYDSLRHVLSPCGAHAAVGELLDDARIATAGSETAPALVILSARFARVSWKYRSIAYATILKDVGVLLQTMYLVTTAMGLAGCAVGAGNATLFARAIGTEWHEESSVGEFLIGSAHASA